MFIAKLQTFHARLYEERHTLAASDAIKRLTDLSRSQLEGNIRAAVGESEEKAVERLLTEIRQFVSMFFTHHPSVLISDFSVSITVQEVKEGLFWTGSGGSSRVSL